MWKNLNTLKECLQKSWSNSCGKDIFSLVNVDFQKIVTVGDVEEVHKLAIIAALTVIMLSKSEAGF